MEAPTGSVIYMSLYNIPFLNGKKSAIAGWGLLLVGLGGLLTAIGTCMQHLDVQMCYSDIVNAYEPFMASLMGLGILGVAHKFEKATPSV